MTGMAGALLIAPNAVQAGDSLLKHLDKKARARKTKELLYYMKKRELIDYTELPDGQLEISVTEQGKRRLERIDFERMNIAKPKKWNGYWNLVLFDIPENRRKSRSALSLKLKNLGFYQLQKSAWVHPYPCRKEIELVQAVYGIDSRNLIMCEVVSVDRAPYLKRHFSIHE